MGHVRDHDALHARKPEALRTCVKSQLLEAYGDFRRHSCKCGEYLRKAWVLRLSRVSPASARAQSMQTGFAPEWARFFG